MFKKVFLKWISIRTVEKVREQYNAYLNTEKKNEKYRKYFVYNIKK